VPAWRFPFYFSLFTPIITSVMLINKSDLKVDFFKSSGPGGQRKNKSETAVRITHLPTGLTVTETSYAHQYQNKKVALLRLEERLRQLNRKKKKRIATNTPRSLKEQILKKKKLVGDKKKSRKKVDFSDY
jgi:peptide chain release factor